MRTARPLAPADVAARAAVGAAILAIGLAPHARAQGASDAEARGLLASARVDIARGRSAAARDALERAESRIRTGSAALAPDDPGSPPAVRAAAASAVADARGAVARRDGRAALLHVERALADLSLAEEREGRGSPRVSAAPSPDPSPGPAPAAPPPPPTIATGSLLPAGGEGPRSASPGPVQGPAEAWVMYPGRWEPRGSGYAWVEPDRAPRPVEPGHRVAGRWAWRDGRYVWEPPRVVAGP